MGSASIVASVICTMAVAVATAACTVMSGVDDMELRSTASGTTPAPVAADATEAGAPGDPFGADATTPPPPPPPPSSSGGRSGTGPALCGAEGSWTDCDATVSVATCATRCMAQGLTCVESCCAFDSVGDYAAQVGMFYAVLPAAECSVKSVSASSRGGLCTDPTILTAGAAAQVRCCCK